MWKQKKMVKLSAILELRIDFCAGLLFVILDILIAFLKRAQGLELYERTGTRSHSTPDLNELCLSSHCNDDTIFHTRQSRRLRWCNPHIVLFWLFFSCFGFEIHQLESNMTNSKIVNKQLNKKSMWNAVSRQSKHRYLRSHPWIVPLLLQRKSIESQSFPWGSSHV